MGGVQNTSGNSRGVGGYSCVQNMEILGGRGSYVNLPLVEGWIFPGTTH